jgi:hypothetical protein
VAALALVAPVVLALGAAAVFFVVVVVFLVIEVFLLLSLDFPGEEEAGASVAAGLTSGAGEAAVSDIGYNVVDRKVDSSRG